MGTGITWLGSSVSSGPAWNVNSQKFCSLASLSATGTFEEGEHASHAGSEGFVLAAAAQLCLQVVRFSESRIYIRLTSARATFLQPIAHMYSGSQSDLMLTGLR